MHSYGHVLVSGSRDRYIHVYDGQDYEPLMTKRHLNSAVVDVRFSERDG